jgi:hypothetical protein
MALISRPLDVLLGHEKSSQDGVKQPIFRPLRAGEAAIHCSSYFLFPPARLGTERRASRIKKKNRFGDKCARQSLCLDSSSQPRVASDQELPPPILITSLRGNVVGGVRLLWYKKRRGGDERHRQVPCELLSILNMSASVNGCSTAALVLRVALGDASILRGVA